MSVVRLDAIHPQYHDYISAVNSRITVGAGGLPLEVVGQVTLPVSIGTLEVKHEYTVVQSLTTDCILGLHFLVDHGAVLDCRVGKLVIGNHPRLEVPVCIKNEKNQEVLAILCDTIELPARSVCQLVWRQCLDKRDW